MIGQGTIVIKVEANKNELHFVDPWELAWDIHDVKDSPAKLKKFNTRILRHIKKRKWKPDAVVDDAELKKILKSTNCAPEKKGTKGYHEYASDCFHIIDQTKT